MNKSLSFKLVQTNLAWEDPDANIEYLNSLVEQGEPADVIVLPEMFTTGFSMNAQTLAASSFEKGISWMQKKSQETGSVICGSMMCKQGDDFFNRFVWMNPDNTSEFYDKRHLFSIGHENEFYKSGEEQKIINHNGFRIRPLICYDLRFPAWSRNKAEGNEGEYDILLYVANWPERRIEHWKTLLKARAIENAAYVVAVNRIGDDGNGISHNGLSAAVNYKGDAVFLHENTEQTEVFTVELDSLKEYRKIFPVLEDADDFVVKMK
jgi:omega-amidase